MSTFPQPHEYLDDRLFAANMTVRLLNFSLTHATCHATWYGWRVVSTPQTLGQVSLEELIDRTAEIFRSQSQTPDDQDARELFQKLQSYFDQSDLEFADSNCWTQLNRWCWEEVLPASLDSKTQLQWLITTYQKQV